MYGELQNTLLQMHKDRAGRKILDKALIEKFLPPDDANYDDVRRFKAEAEKKGFVNHEE